MRKFGRKLGVVIMAVSVAMAVLPITVAQAHNFNGDGDCESWTLTLDGTWGARNIYVDGVVVNEGGPGNSAGPNPGSPFTVSIADDSDASSRSFVVVWQKGSQLGSNDVTVVRNLTRDLGDCGEDEETTTTTTTLPEPEKVTICHIAGKAEDPANTVVIGPLPLQALNGHFDEQGTQKAGHEQDFFIESESDLALCTHPDPDPVTVSASGNCVVGDQGVAIGAASISVDPDDGAEVIFDGNIVTEGDLEVAPGSYSWSATANPGFELNGASEGTVIVEDCSDEKPDDDVDFSEWVDGEFGCGDTTVEQTRTRTTTSYIWDAQAQAWVAGTPVVVNESQTRDLTEAEQFDCPVDVVAPTLNQQPACDVPESLFIPVLENIDLEFNDENVEGDTLEGPLSGEIVATLDPGFAVGTALGWVQTEGGLVFEFNLAGPVPCEESTTTTTTILDSTTTTVGDTTTTVADTTTTAPEEPEEPLLPFTGFDALEMFALALVGLVIGSILVAVFRDKQTS